MRLWQIQFYGHGNFFYASWHFLVCKPWQFSCAHDSLYLNKFQKFIQTMAIYFLLHGNFFDFCTSWKFLLVAIHHGVFHLCRYCVVASTIIKIDGNFQIFVAILLYNFFLSFHVGLFSCIFHFLKYFLQRDSFGPASLAKGPPDVDLVDGSDQGEMATNTTVRSYFPAASNDSFGSLTSQPERSGDIDVQK